MKINDSIRKYRLKSNYSQEGFAELLGKSRRWLCKIEAGEIDPKFSILEKIADTCKINLTQLLNDTGEGYTEKKVET